MKSIKKLLVVVLAITIFASCGGFKKMLKNANTVTYKATPEVLEMHGGKVDFKLKITFPANYFAPKATVEIVPVVVYEGGEKALKPIKLQGEKVQANDKVIALKTGGSVSYSDQFDFVEGMKKSKVVLRLKAVEGSKANSFPEVTVAQGVVATSLLVDIDPKNIMSGDEYKMVVADAYNADIHYQIQQSNIRWKELKSEDIKLLKDYIKEIKSAENKTLKNIEISSYASPDGSEKLNSRLADLRQKTSKRFMNKSIRRAKMKKITDEKYKLTEVAEDWAGFKDLMKNSTIEDKELILRVLSMYSDPVVREKEIKNIAAVYENVAKDVLPKLRRSQIKVNIDVTGRNDEEIISQFDTDATQLNELEILHAGGITKTPADQIKYFEKATELFPKSWKAFNNLACSYIETKQYAKARTALDAAKSLEAENAYIINNIGVLELYAEKTEKAEEYFVSANGAGNVALYNRGIINIIQGEYPNAVKQFGAETTCNVGLAKILAGDSSAAITILDKADNVAKASYLKAIAYARLKEFDNAVANLKIAIEKDASFKDVAKKDMEFYSMSTNAGFTALVQ